VGAIQFLASGRQYLVTPLPLSMYSAAVDVFLIQLQRSNYLQDCNPNVREPVSCRIRRLDELQEPTRRSCARDEIRDSNLSS